MCFNTVQARKMVAGTHKACLLISLVKFKSSRELFLKVSHCFGSTPVDKGPEAVSVSCGLAEGLEGLIGRDERRAHHIDKAFLSRA